MKPSSDKYRLSQRRVKGDVMRVLYREQTLGTLIQGQWKIVMQTEKCLQLQGAYRERGNQTERENNPDGGNPDPRGEATAGSAPEEGLGITGETTPENIHPLLRTSQQVVEI